jgi:flagellin
MIDTAEGGHREIEAILQRLREISVQGASDTNNAQDRGNLQAETDALITEIDRIAGVTTWAGNSVMAGDGTVNSSKTFSLQVGAATGAKNQIEVVVKAVDASTLGVRNVGVAATAGTLNFSADSTAITEVDNVATAGSTNNSGTLKIAAGDNTTAADLAITIDGTAISIVGLDRTTDTATLRQAESKLLADAINSNAALSAKGIYASVEADDGADSVVAVHQGADNMQSAAASRAAIHAIDEAIKTVNTQRSELGAVSNRLSHTVSNMTNISTNLSAARGGIEDADFALETTNLAKNQILQQASTAMLAQANASKQNVLSLLQ